MPAPLPQVLDNADNAQLLRAGRFAVGGGRFLAYQADKTALAQAQTGGGTARGTVLLFNDWGAPFDSDEELLAALRKRGFCAAGYEWYRQGSREKPEIRKTKSGRAAPERYICRFDTAVLHRFLQNVVLPEYPAPFYVLAQGLGALFALGSQNILRSAISRMALISPPMSVRSHAPNGFYHLALKILSSFTPHNKKRKDAAQHSLAYKANLLDCASYILSPVYCKNMNTPCLIISAARDQKANLVQIRLLTEKLRFADNLIIPAATPNVLRNSAYQRNQFWAAFDAFIPGSDAFIANDRLEHPVLR